MLRESVPECFNSSFTVSTGSNPLAISGHSMKTYSLESTYSPNPISLNSEEFLRRYKSKWNILPSGRKYSFTIEKLGLVTLSEEPKDWHMALIRVVLPAPKSPKIAKILRFLQKSRISGAKTAVS